MNGLPSPSSAHLSDISRYLEDASGTTGHAESAVAPASVSEVEEVVRYCAKNQVPLTVAGAGTGLTGARVPMGGWVVSMERFRKLEITRGRANCGSGVSLQELAKAAAATGQFLGPNPTEWSAAVGGAVSTNAGGARSFRYGPLRQQVLALRATFMSGETRRFVRGQKVDFQYQLVHVPETTKNSAGYFLRPDLDWVDLLVGSEGTLALISEVELVLQPDPAAVLSGVIFFNNEDDALTAIETWRPVPDLRLLEYMDEPALNFLRPHHSNIPPKSTAALLIEQNLSSQEDPELDRWTDRLEAGRADLEGSWFGFSATDQERFREFRHLLPVIVVERGRRNGFHKYGTDFAVPLRKGRSTHEYFRRECQAALPGRYTIFGHAGDANNHINLLPESPSDAELADHLIRTFATYVVEQGGTIAAEHGIGKNKKDLFKLMYSPEEIAAMRAVKQHLDPEWLLGRGTIFDS